MRVSADSLHGLLLRWLLPPLLALLVLASWASYFGAHVAVTRAFDRSLLDPVQALSQHIVFEHGHPVLMLSQDTLHPLFTHVYDTAYFQISDEHGRQFAGDLTLPVPPKISNKPQYYDAIYDNQAVRVVAMRVDLDSDPAVEEAPHFVIIQIAQTLIRRDRNLYELMALMVAPALVIAIAAGLLVSVGVTKGLKPLHALQQEIASRSHLDLRPVPVDHAPLEVRPVVVSLNALLGELAAVMEGQQRFLANAAHQLRTPLAGLHTQVELLLREQMPEHTEQVLNTLLDATRRATHLANQLLTLARAEPTTEHLVNRQAIDLAVMVEASMVAWLARARSKRIDLGFELSPAVCAADVLLLPELFANLIDNALRYTPDGGMITVRTYAAGGVAVLEVEDNGMGIPEAQREKVLERFYRVAGSPGNGCGLGLSIVAEIVRQHQASLQILTPVHGAGTLMRVCFPVCT
jgi:two-component system sensor histidine kinase TctE